MNGTTTSSSSLVVADSTYFQDGYGLHNAYSTISGDCIKVASWSSAPVCITAVNYSTNTLTLSSPISATNGDSVWLASHQRQYKCSNGCDRSGYGSSSVHWRLRRLPAPPMGLAAVVQ